ncbi:hypothetical protein ACVGWI_00705, partial [Enterobacter hormaechei]
MEWEKKRSWLSGGLFFTPKKTAHRVRKTSPLGYFLDILEKKPDRAGTSTVKKQPPRLFFF